MTLTLANGIPSCGVVVMSGPYDLVTFSIVSRRRESYFAILVPGDPEKADDRDFLVECSPRRASTRSPAHCSSSRERTTARRRAQSRVTSSKGRVPVEEERGGWLLRRAKRRWKIELALCLAHNCCCVVTRSATHRQLPGRQCRARILLRHLWIASTTRSKPTE